MALSSQILGLVTQRLLMTMFHCSFEMPDREGYTDNPLYHTVKPIFLVYDEGNRWKIITRQVGTD